MITFLQALTACSILMLFFMTVALARQWPPLFLIVLGTVTFVAWEFPSMGAIASPGGYSIYLLDILSIALVSVAVTNLRHLQRSGAQAKWLWLLMAFLFIASLARGIATFGFNMPINEARGFLTLISATVWIMSLDTTSGKTMQMLRRYVLSIGWALTVAGVYHAFRYGVGGASDFVDASGIEQTGRILVSGQAMVVALCALLCLHMWAHQGKNFYLWSGISFSAIVLVSQHRSVWIAIATAALAYVVLGGRIQRKATVLLGIFTAWIAVFIIASGIADGFIHQLQDSSENTSTYDARTSSWDYLISKAIADGPGTLLFGAPLGSGFDRIEPNGLFVTYQPHNIYVSVFLRLGVIGLGVYLLALVASLLEGIRKRDGLGFAILVGICIYGWAYGPTWYFFIFLALGLSGTSDNLLSKKATDDAIPDNSFRRKIVL